MAFSLVRFLHPFNVPSVSPAFLTLFNLLLHFVLFIIPMTILKKTTPEELNWVLHFFLFFLENICFLQG